MADTNNEPMTPYTVVCTGLTELSDGKLGVVLQLTDAENMIGSERYIFAEKFASKALIRTGGMYKIEFNADMTQAGISKAKYVGQWPIEQDRIKWRAADDALKGAQAALKRQRLDMQDNVVKNALASLRDVWIKTNYTGRLALEVQVLAYLRNGSLIGKKED